MASETVERTESSDDGGSRRPPIRLIIGCAVVALAVLLWGGYVQKWPWTGFSDNDTLWDWLQLLLLPIAIATLPIWLIESEFLDVRRRVLIVGAVVAFVVFVVLGYVIPLDWTGFEGNTLWDWVTLLLLPLVVITIKQWDDIRDHIGTRHRVASAIGLCVLIGFIVVGYVRPWAWTGFEGNTLWDWIQLLAVPVLVPAVLLPMATDLIKGEADERREAAEARRHRHDDARAGAEDASKPPPPSRSRSESREFFAAIVTGVVALVVGGVAGALAF
jgi:hypothetical protein